MVEDVERKVADLTEWWLKGRLAKARHASFGSMAVNPFLAPLIMVFHGHATFDDLANFLIGGHFLIGHATGFGKLVDEKLLPRVFGTTKLDAAYRRIPPFNNTEFDNVDHIVHREDGDYYLSLKAGKWTIQLGQAVELNRSFSKLLSLREEGVVSFEKIVVATFYGKEEDLTDKYRILRGITTGKEHDVEDLTDDVIVYAGREFWTWIGHDEDHTQDRVMKGLLLGINHSRKELESAKAYLDKFRTAFAESYASFICEDGTVDWLRFIEEING